MSIKAQPFNALHLPGWTIQRYPHLGGQGDLLDFVARPDDAERPAVCGRCSDGGRPKRHMRVGSNIRDVPAFGHPVEIRVDRQRYRCRCGWTGYAEVPDIDDTHQMTTRCRDYVIERAALYPFVMVARELGIAETKVRTVALSAWTVVPDYEFETPRYLGIDEIILRDSGDEQDPGPRKRAVFVDIETGRVLDILQSNTKKAVGRWISALPNRQRVRIVTTDFELTYRDLVAYYMPDARVVVDKWHAMKGIWEALDAVRVETLRKHGQKVFNDAATLQMRNMLRATKIDSTDKRWIVREEFLNRHPDVRLAYDLKVEFCEIWEQAPDAPTALLDLLFWRDRVSGLPAHVREHFKALKNVIDKNMWDVLAYFDFPLTNASTEAMNRIIRKINGAGQGLRLTALRYRVRAYSRVRRSRTFICDRCLRRRPLKLKIKHKVMIDGNRNLIFDKDLHNLCDTCYIFTCEFLKTEKFNDYRKWPQKARVATVAEIKWNKEGRKDPAKRIKTGRPFFDTFGY